MLFSDSRKVLQTLSFRGRRSRNKVSVDESAEGSFTQERIEVGNSFNCFHRKSESNLCDLVGTCSSECFIYEVLCDLSSTTFFSITILITKFLDEDILQTNS